MKIFHFKTLYIVILLVIAAFFFTGERHASFDDWISALTAEQIQWAEFAKNYGVEKTAYDAPEYEYPSIAAQLKAITEDQCTRKKATPAVEEDYRLALRFHDKLWLFKCRTDGTVSLTFEDEETAKYFGCESSSLIIHNSNFWNYIITMVDTYGI